MPSGLFRRLGWAVSATASILSVAACGTSAGRGATTTPTAAPTTTTAATTTNGPGGTDFLTAWGASPGQWNANHTPDPGSRADYWPKLPDGLDTYTNLQVVGGRVVGYVLNLYPSVALADAKSRLANDLPLDTAVVSEQPLAGCDQLVESGPTIKAVSPGGVLAELESSGSYSPDAVSRVVVAPMAPGTVPAAAC